MIQIEWTTQAFAQLEALPQAIAVEIIRRTDALQVFPEMGVSLCEQLQSVWNYRQLIIKRKHRVIYRYDREQSLIYIAAIQHCRQQLADYSDLQRAIRQSQPKE
ncbi:MAG: type II toxin-antitoxin system RelE/ParE family toxin [Acidobacteria bacterium]|nr:type II toxin-antitoxin system RelE/ParE family toxin [Acidobacteriota bacterium]